MKSKTSIKPITYMKTHAADILQQVTETGETMVITHNGEAKMVIQDVTSYQAMTESIAMLKLAALGSRAAERGKVQTARKAFDGIEKRRDKRRG